MSNFLDVNGLSYAWNKIKALLAGKQPSGDYTLKSEIPTVPVQSVNGQTGAVSLSASDVGAATEWYVDIKVAAIKPVPSCTADDNGKILSVVNGVPTWIPVINAEGVAY